MFVLFNISYFSMASKSIQNWDYKEGSNSHPYPGKFQIPHLSGCWSVELIEMITH